MHLKRMPVRVVLPVALMGLLAVLATLQYRWLGQVSEAERDRMRATVSARATTLAEDVDREITRLFVVFQLGPAADDTASALAARLETWRSTAKFPKMLSTVYVATFGDPRGNDRTPPPPPSLRKLDADSRILEPARWDDGMAVARERLEPAHMQRPGTFVLRIAPLVVDNPLLVAVPLARRERLPGPLMDMRYVADGSEYVLLALDEAYVRTEMLPALIAEHLKDNTTDYHVAIVRASNPESMIYTSDGTRIIKERADVVSSMLSLRFALADRLVTHELHTSAVAAGIVPATPDGRAEVAGRVTLFVEQRKGSAAAGTAQTAVRLGSINGGAWQLLLKHRAGSLEAAVAQIRRRNLVMSFGMLALLAASTGLMFVSARRAERLAAQQMDFVATVSHELRTPLAVIRSAGQNLADGVVHDTEQARRYGELIENEGRRLTDMIEQTLALAGLSGDRRPLAPEPLEAGGIVRDVMNAPDIAVATAGLHKEVRVQSDLPPVLADGMLLRRAVQNLVTNAIKYGNRTRGDGQAAGWIGVSVDVAGAGRAREVRITVSDRGPGIDSRDLPHLFEPFYRGREAMATQVQGNGLGLHLVKRIAEAHGGRVSVQSTAGRGAAFTLHLPVHTGGLAEPAAGTAPQHT